METKRKNMKIPLLRFFIGMVIISCCFPALSFCMDETIQHPEVISKIAVIPFIKGRYGISTEEMMNAPISRFYYSRDNISQDGHSIITGYVYNRMKNRYGENLVPQTDTNEIFNRLKEQPDITLQTLAREIGKILDIDYVILGNVWRFKDRVGNALAVDSPASIAFNTFLIKTGTGKILWKATFDKTQQTLTGNLLEAADFFKAGGKWLTSREFARLGVEKVLGTYPY